MTARDPIVGRQAELADLKRRVAAGTSRLLTITGPGGVGKTRVALELIGDGTRALFVDLSEARSDDDLIRHVAAALDVSLAPARTSADATALVGRELAARECPLVVLDNFEQILGARAIVGQWLSAADHVHFVVTSREALGLAEEAVVPIAPLPERDAIDLFVHRAEQRGATLAQDAETRAVLREIVARLEGIALAIELAAARADVLGPKQLLDRLDRGALRLGVADGGAPSRQSTMRATIAWSFELLDEAERSALTQVSVFRGGFTVDAAEGVLELSRPVLDVLSALRSKHLLWRREAPNLVGETRLGMLEAVRAFAFDALADRREEAFERHARWVVGTCEHWAGLVHGARGAEYLARLTLEEENLLAVVERSRHWALVGRDDGIALGLRALLSLEPLMNRRAPAPYLAATAELLDRTEATFATEHGALVSAIHIARAHTLRWAGETSASGQELERALRIARAGGAARQEAEAEQGIGVLAVIGERLDEGRAMLQSGLAIAEGAGEGRLAARIRLDLRTTEHRMGRLGAWDAIAPVLPDLEAHGDLEALAQARTRLAMFLLDEGGVAEARGMLDASIAFYRSRSDRRREAWLHRTIALLEHVAGALPAAEKHARRALELECGMGLRFGGANSRLTLGGILREAGKVAEAEGELRRASIELAAAGDPRHAGLAASRLGGLLAGCDRTREAELAFETAEEKLGSLGDIRPKLANDIERGQLDLAIARRALATQDAKAATAAMDAARSRLRAAHALGPDGPVIRQSLDAVLAARALELALATVEPPADALVVGEDGRWLRPSNGERVSIEHRPVLVRLLRGLLVQRARAPGTALDREALIAIAWPGETMQAAAANNRLHVALTTLRKLGIGAAIVRAGDGWLLDPKAALVVQGGPPPA